MINLRTTTDKRKEWLAKRRLRIGFVRALAPRLAAEFKRVASAASKAYENGGSTVAALGDHQSRLQKIVIPTLIAAATAFGKRARNMIKKSDIIYVEIKDTEAELVLRIAAFARNRSRLSMARVSNTTQNRINRVIHTGIADGLSRSEIADNIEAATGGRIGEARAGVIAETEVHSASNAGELDSIKALDVPLDKEWLSMNDELVREDHAAANGERVGLDETFEVGEDQLQYPGDPEAPPAQTVNCRCIMVYNQKAG